jgi:hypothetical protein
MKRTLVVAAILIGLVSAQPALAKDPPSFALWTAQWATSHDRVMDKLLNGCKQLYGGRDRKLGECLTKGARVVLRSQAVVWERQVARVARGRSVACKKAIHSYWLASRKAQKATLIYFDGHPHTDLSEIYGAFTDEPFSTLHDITDAAKSKAIRVCG